MSTPNERLRATAAALGRSMKSLLVMDAKNDPFNTGTATHVAAAEWVAGIHARHPAVTTHLRRLHYKAVDDPTPKPDGTRHLNTEKNWKWLLDAGKWARDLQLIPDVDVIDRRSSAWQWNDARPLWWRPRHGHPLLIADAIPPDIDDPDVIESLSLKIDPPSVSTFYDYDHTDDVRIGVVVEKSTVDDVLVPLCQRLHLDYLAATGYTSRVRIGEWLRHDPDRPARLLYISDFDPAGDKMPRAFARALEFLIMRDGDKIDAAVQPLALTVDQVHHYQLPTIPMDMDVDRAVIAKRQKFMDKYGVPGAVELDALVTRHPGELERLIADAVADIRDQTLRVRLADARDDAAQAVDAVWQRHQPRVRAAEADILPAFVAAREAFQAALAEIDTSDLDAALDAVNEELEQLDLPDRPQVERIDREHDWLFRSDRSYLQQLDHYRIGDGR